MTTAWAPCTAGELVQGWLDDEPVQITAPIDWYVRASADPSAPPLPPKARAAIAWLEARTGRALSDAIALSGGPPSGRGYGRSTADIVAAAAVALRGAGIVPRADLLAEAAAAVEPSDGLMHPGIALFAHRSGRLLEALGRPTRIALVIVDPGGEVDTVAFNAASASADLRRMAPVTRACIAMARAGIREGNPTLLGTAASLSAFAHQPMLRKPFLEPLWRAACDAGASGVCVAHSGTIAAALVDTRKADPRRVADTVLAEGFPVVGVARLIGGGVRFTPPRSLPPV